MTNVFLITGCSSGIGLATAHQLVDAGYVVYATARQVDTLAVLADKGAFTRALDVTDDASMRAVVDEIESTHGQVDVLINNAGYGEYGPIEEVPIERVRRQFETNVFGLARLTQMVLPAMRESRRGRIINLGSMGGRMVLPMGGYYHATKYALEALTDALRMEVAQFGIHVTLIEPGSIKTRFNETISETLETETSAETGPYAAMKTNMKTALSGAGADAIAGTPEGVAKVIVKAATTRRPRTRYMVTPMARMLIGTHAVLPDRAWDKVARKVMGN